MGNSHWLLLPLVPPAYTWTQGYDLVAHPDGLLEHVYRTLQLPHTKWRGLQALPTVAPSAAGDDFWTMLRSLTEVLDPELAAALPPLRPPARARRRRRQQQGEAGQGQGPVGQQEGWQPSSGGGAGGDGSGGITSAPTSPVHTRGELPGDQLFDGLLNDESEDEEWQADLERERQVQARMEKAAALRRSISPADQQQRLQRQRSSALAQAVRAARAGVTGDAPDTAADLAAGFEKQAWIDEASSSEEEGDTAGNGPGTPVLTQQGGEGTALAGAATPTPAAAPVHASRKGVAAMLALLQCCVGFAPHERPPPSNGQTQHQQWLYSSPTSPTQRLSHGPPPRARWYDARARVALKTMASWLRVTPALMANLECLLTSDKAPASKGYTPAGGMFVCVSFSGGFLVAWWRPQHARLLCPAPSLMQRRTAGAGGCVTSRSGQRPWGAGHCLLSRVDWPPLRSQLGSCPSCPPSARRPSLPAAWRGWAPPAVWLSPPVSVWYVGGSWAAWNLAAPGLRQLLPCLLLHLGLVDEAHADWLPGAPPPWACCSCHRRSGGRHFRVSYGSSGGHRR